MKHITSGVVGLGVWVGVLVGVVVGVWVRFIQGPFGVNSV